MGGFASLTPGSLSGYGGAFSGIAGSTTGTEDVGTFGPQIYKRKSPQRKEQMLGDISSIAGIGSLEAGGKLLAQPAKYYSDILSGDRQKMLEAEAPEVSNIMSAYNAARRSGSEFTPRGGGRVQALEEAPYKEAGAVTSLLQQARPEAAKEITSIAKNLQNLGLSEEFLGSEAFQAVMGYNLQQQKTRNELWSSIGQSAGGVLAAAIPYL